MIDVLDAEFMQEAHTGLNALLDDFDMAKAYVEGAQALPYAPPGHDEAIGDLLGRSIYNLMSLLVEAPTQVSVVEGYRRGKLLGQGDAKDGLSGDDAIHPPEFQHWLAAMEDKQSVVLRAALTYGHSYVATGFDRKLGGDRVKLRILPTRQTIAYYDDAVNDARPACVFHFRSLTPREQRFGPEGAYLEVEAWDEKFYHHVIVDSGFKVLETVDSYPHGVTGCPVVRYAPFTDDEGSSDSLVLQAVPAQDRVNQSVFDTNVTSGYGAFTVRWAAGLVPSYRTNPETGELVLDSQGKPIPEAIPLSQLRMLMSSSPDTKFGNIPGTPLDGHIKAEEASIRNFATARQFPAHIFLGNVSQLSAEALSAAEAQFRRWVQQLQRSIGATLMEQLRIIAELIGEPDGANAYGGEVRWRRFDHSAFSQVMDGLAKGVESLGIPRRGAWTMVPGVTTGTLELWEEWAESEAQQFAEGFFSDAMDALDREVESSVAPLTDEVIGDVRPAQQGAAPRG